MKNRMKVLSDRFSDAYRLFLLPDKAYIKFHEKYMGEKITSDEVEEARFLIVKMCLNDILKDMEVILYEMQKEE